MPFVPFQAQPKPAQVPFVTFEDSKEMGIGEQEHAGDVIAFGGQVPTQSAANRPKGGR